MGKSKEVQKLVEVARMYYEEGLTQSEIAAKVKVSRPSISYILNRAKELGIVNITIRSPIEADEELLDLLKKQFGLEGGLIIPSSNYSKDVSLKNLISQAALELERDLSNWNSIGVGWGNIISELVDTFSKQEVMAGHSIEVCPLIGSMTSLSRDWHPNELARQFSEKLAGKASYLHAPAFPGTKKNWEIYNTTAEHKYIKQLWKRLDTALVEVETYPSVPDQVTAMRFGNVLNEKHAVGGILSYHFDIKGNLIHCRKSDHVIRIPLAILKNIKRKILIFTGNIKVHALLGALRTGLITHLITDDIMAKKILDFEK